MQIIIKEDKNYILRFDKGDEVIEGLRDFMAAESLSAFAFNGIGACSFAQIGYFDKILRITLKARLMKIWKSFPF